MTGTEPLTTDRQSRWVDDAARMKVTNAKERLRTLGWDFREAGWHGLPPFRIIEKWHRAGAVLYMVYNHLGEWDLLCQVSPINDTEAIFRSLTKIKA